jgi:hypothetical protein
MYQRQDLLAAPGGVPLPRFQQCRDNVFGGCRRRRPRPPWLVFKSGGAMGQISVHPLVAGLAADAVELAELLEGEAVPQIISDERCLLVHGRCLTPGHGAPPLVPRSIVKLSPMSPDYTVTYVLRPYRHAV